jgi:WD40 repeat protein
VSTAAQLDADHPFPGLRPFDKADAGFFFGREEQIGSLYRMLDRSRFIAVVGSSGSGKSSLVRAGLQPLLAKESVGQGGRTWRVATLHPGDKPLAALTDAIVKLGAERAADRGDPEIRRAAIDMHVRGSSFGLSTALDDVLRADGACVLLVVDQFEELFRYARGASESPERRITDSLWRDEAAAFVQLLLEATRSRSSSIYVMITMRSDFIGDCAQFHGLPEAVSASQFLTPSLSRDQREAVIREPLVAANATIESVLVERLLNDASDENDQLPVLQHCLAELWREAGATRRLTLDTYKDVGGMSGALSGHAERILRSPKLIGLTPIVEQVFRALSEVDGDQRAIRRPLKFSELLAETGADEGKLRDVLDHLRDTDCLFIVPARSAVAVLTNEERIDVVHEALLRRWERISAVRDTSLGEETGWLDAEQHDGRAYRGLLALLPPPSAERAATLPLDQVDDKLAWWRERLRTEAWAERYGGRLQRVKQLFADSVAALERQRAAQREQERLEQQAQAERRRANLAQRLERRTRKWAAVVGVVALLALVAAGVAVRQYAIANEQTRLAVAAKADAEKNYKKAVLAAGARDRAQRELLRFQSMRKKQADLRNAAEKKADIRRLAVAGEQNRLLAAANANAERSAGDARAAAARAGVAQGVAERERRNAKIAHAEAYVEPGRQALIGQRIDEAALYLAAAYKMGADDPDLLAMLPRTLRLLRSRGPQIIDAHGTRDVGKTRLGNAVSFVAFDGSRPRFISAGADGTVQLWDTSRLRSPLASMHAEYGAITATALDPKGRYVAVGWEDGALALGSLPTAPGAKMTRTMLKRPEMAGQQWRINAVAFSSDGNSVASASADGTIVVWDTASRSVQDVWSPQSRRAGALYANQIAFGDKDVVVAALRNGELRTYDWRAKKEIGTGDSSLAGAATALAVSPDGQRAAMGAADGTMLLYDVAGNREVAKRHDGTAAINAVVFDAQERVVTAGADGDVRIVPFSAGPTIATPARPANAPPAVTVAFSAPAKLIAATYANGTVSFFTRDGDSIASFGTGTTARVTTSSFSGDGKVLVTGSDDGRVTEWYPRIDLPSGDGHGDAVESLAVSPSGTRVLSGARDGTAILWDLRGKLTKRANIQRASRDWVTRTEFDGDDRALVLGGDAIRVFTLAGGHPRLEQTIRPTADRRRFTDAAFIPRQNAVFAIQTGADPLALAPYRQNLWFIWSLQARGVVRKEPPDSWESAARNVQVSSDGRNAMLFTAALSRGHMVDLSGSANHTLWGGLTAASLARGRRDFAYFVGVNNGTVTLMSLHDKRVYREAFPDQSPVSALAGSDDDRWLGIAHAESPTAVIWDTRRHVQRAVLRGHTGTIRSITFSPGDAHFVVTLGDDGSARLWDRDTGAALASEALPGAKITVARFTADGSIVVLGASDGAVLAWPLHDRHLTVVEAARDVLAASCTMNIAGHAVLEDLIKKIGEPRSEGACQHGHRTLSQR